MKKLLLILPFILNAESFNEIVSNISNSYLYKLSQKEVLLAKKSVEVAKSLNYGKIDMSYTAIRMFNRPIMKMNSLQPVAVASDGVHLIYQDVYTKLPMSDKSHFIGEIKYSYPIFSGFAITGNIEKSKIKYIQAKLKLKNTKRVILLNSAKLYSAIYALNQELKALNFSKKALIDAREKVVALYKEGLTDKAQVSEIEAKYYEVIAKIKEVKAKKQNLLNSLSTLLNTKINKISSLPNLKLKQNLNPKKRADVREVYKNLDIADIEEKLAKSSFYPQVGFEIALKREADNIGLSRNDYQNVDKSYAGIGIKWNIFNGGADKTKLQMAKIAKIQALLYYQNYLNNAKTELNEDLSTLKAFKYQLKAAVEEVKARKTYYEKIKSKFDEGLADSVDLNDALAKYTAAIAKREYIKSQIFFYTLKANLDGGYDD